MRKETAKQKAARQRLENHEVDLDAEVEEEAVKRAREAEAKQEVARIAKEEEAEKLAREAEAKEKAVRLAKAEAARLADEEAVRMTKKKVKKEAAKMVEEVVDEETFKMLREVEASITAEEEAEKTRMVQSEKMFFQCKIKIFEFL